MYNSSYYEFWFLYNPFLDEFIWNKDIDFLVWLEYVRFEAEYWWPVRDFLKQRVLDTYNELPEYWEFKFFQNLFGLCPAFMFWFRDFWKDLIILWWRYISRKTKIDLYIIINAFLIAYFIVEVITRLWIKYDEGILMEFFIKVVGPHWIVYVPIHIGRRRCQPIWILWTKPWLPLYQRYKIIKFDRDTRPPSRVIYRIERNDSLPLYKRYRIISEDRIPSDTKKWQGPTPYWVKDY